MSDDFPSGDLRPAVARTRAARALDAGADAVRFFTRLAVPADWGSPAPEKIFDGIAIAAPLAGVIVGAASGLAIAFALAIGLPDLPAAVFAVAAGLLITGALHQDGLADMADGFGGGKTLARKLRIMRDSAVGSYGVAALVMALLARVALTASLADRLGESGAFAGLVAAAAIARPLALVPTQLLDPARPDGAGHAARPGLRPVAIGCLAGTAVALVFGGAAGGAAAVALGTAAALGVVALARSQIGGYTGDVCGAPAELAEIAALVGLVAAAA